MLNPFRSVAGNPASFVPVPRGFASFRIVPHVGLRGCDLHDQALHFAGRVGRGSFRSVSVRFGLDP